MNFLNLFETITYYLEVLMTLFQSILSLLFPPHCIICGNIIYNNELNLICDSCAGTVVPLSEYKELLCSRCSKILNNPSSSLCYDCSRTNYTFQRNTSLFYYRHPIIYQLVQLLKFEGNKQSAKDLAEILREPIQNFLSHNNSDCTVVVPLSKDSLRERGYNQVELILNHLNIDYISPLQRLKHELHLSLLSKNERWQQIQGQFKIKLEWQGALEGRRVLLIDDIFTTGSTVNECGRVLLEAGAREVEVLTFFRA